MQDLFISHAGRDKEHYINPLTEALASRNITFWLDNLEIGWGDSIVMKINEGLANSRFVLLCLSQAFLRRPWPEAELGSALSIQNNNGIKRVLPLILNSKDEVLARYPLLAGLAYRELSVGVSVIADEISAICGQPSRLEGEIQVTVESVYTGKLCSITADPKVSVKWLADRAKAGIGVTDLADTGAYEPFHVRWVLVDTRAEKEWRLMPRDIQQRLRALIATEEGVMRSESDYDRLVDIGVRDDIVFHIYAIEDIHWITSPAAPGGPPSSRSNTTPVDSNVDPLLAEAIDLVRREGRASVSMLQRRMRIGYTRAARIVDMMEDRGIVGPPEGTSQLRQVLDYGPTVPPKDDEM